MLHNNLLALILTFIIALVWLRINDFIAHRGWVSSEVSRKIIHIGTGPIFVLCWPLFTEANISRYLAALVPGMITLQFLLVGLGAIKDDAAVKAMSRSGARQEILRGPLFYGIVFILLTIIYWMDSPVGIIALMLMCGGDGLADLIGRRPSSVRLPWSPRKSWNGMLAMFLGGWIFSAAILWIYVRLGIFPNSITTYLPALTLIALVGTLVETLPMKDIDNITVTLAAVIAGHLLL